MKTAPLHMSLPFGALISRFFTGWVVVAEENEETVFPTMKINKSKMEQSILHVKHQVQPSSLEKQEKEFKEEYDLEGEYSMSTQLSNLDNTIYDQLVLIENMERRVDERLNQVTNKLDSIFDWVRQH